MRFKQLYAFNYAMIFYICKYILPKRFFIVCTVLSTLIGDWNKWNERAFVFSYIKTLIFNFNFAILFQYNLLTCKKFVMKIMLLKQYLILYGKSKGRFYYLHSILKYLLHDVNLSKFNFSKTSVTLYILITNYLVITK